MYKVVKRDGKITDFDISKISAAITKAFEAQNKQYNPDIIDLLALKVTADFEPKIKDSQIAVEDIQDSVENVLIKAGYGDVAKAYILYRKNREKIRNMKSTILDYKELVDSYVKVTDWRVKEIPPSLIPWADLFCPTRARLRRITGLARFTTRR